MNQLSQVLLASPHSALIVAELKNDGDWAKLMTANHLEPGVVKYDQEDGTSRTYLLTREAIAKMRSSAEGKPIVGKSGGFDHKSVKPTDYQEGQADGVVVESFDGEDGWEKIRFMVWDKATKSKCRPGGYQISCAYIPGNVLEKSGLWHNVPYDAVILDGSYTHFAVVPNPRYEGAVIFANSIKEGGLSMFKLLFGGKTVELDKETKISIDGKETPLSELVNSIMAIEAKKATVTAAAEAKNALADDSTQLEVGGRKMTLGELKAAHLTHLKNTVEEEEVKKNAEAEAAKKAADEAAKNASESEIAAMWDSTFVGSGCDDDFLESLGLSDKAIADVSKDGCKPYASQPAEVKRIWKAAYEDAHGNAADMKAKCAKANSDPVVEKEAIEGAGAECDDYKIKQNAEGGFDVFGKDGKHVVNAQSLKAAQDIVAELHGETEKKAAAEKAKADEEAKANEAAKAQHFNALRKAAQRRQGSMERTNAGISTPVDKEDLGRERYGSPVRS